MTNPNDDAVEDPSLMAFPHEVEGFIAPGLTKREYFAGLAMQGIRSSGTKENGDFLSSETLASISLRDAKALIAELNKKSKE